MLQQPSSESSMGKIPRSRSRVLGQLLEKVRPNIQDRERSKSAGQTTEKSTATTPTAPKTPKKILCNSTSQMDNVSKFEAQIREKLHDIMCRRQSQPSSKSDTEMDKKLKQEERKFSKTDLDGLAKLTMKQRILYKKIGKSCDKINATAEKKCRPSVEAEYQRISEATSQKMPSSRSRSGSPKGKSNKGNKTQPKARKKVYPYSDGEDNIFYSLNDSADSLSTSSRRSSFDAATHHSGTNPDKTLVVVINRRQKGAQTLAQKQRSWETFPPKHKRHQHVCQSKLSAPTHPGPLRKTDSFEGHEEAVRSLVAAVQETRRKPLNKGNDNN